MPSERKNIMQPPDWWEAFKRQSDKSNLTLSEWIGETCLQALPRRDRERLSTRPPAHRPRKDNE